MKLAAFPKCYMDELCVTRSMTVFDWIEMARDLQPIGVTGLELYPGFLAETTQAYRERVNDALRAAGFAMPMLCYSPDFTLPEEGARARQVALTCFAIDMAAFFGARTCRVLSGQRRPEVTLKKGIKWVVECIEALTMYAEKRGVILAMENHFKDNYWDYPEFAQRMDVFCEILDRIPSPWLGVNYDPSNALLAGEDPLALLERVKHRVVSMHASDRRPRPGAEIGAAGITDYSQLIHGELGTGLIDFDAIFRILDSVGFDGWVSIEDGVTGMEELKRSAAFIAEKILHH